MSFKFGDLLKIAGLSADESNREIVGFATDNAKPSMSEEELMKYVTTSERSFLTMRNLDPVGWRNAREQAPHCKACRRSTDEHTPDGKCLFGPSIFEDTRTVYRWESQSLPGNRKWFVEVKNDGKINYTDANGKMRSTTLDKFFDLLGAK